jgi:hypothetical protein
VVSETVERCGGHFRVAENARSFAEGEIGGDEDRGALIEPADEMEEKLASEIAFGALEAGLEVEYARDSIGFRWAGSDEGDEVQGEGTAELLDDGTIEIGFVYNNGDEAVLKAKRHPSSTAY